MLIDFILPDSLDPTLKLIVNLLVGVHLLAFICYIVLLARSFGTKPEDHFQQKVNKLTKQD